MDPEATTSKPTGEPSPRGSWWSRHKTLVNFWLDAALMVLFLVHLWLLTVCAAVFPRMNAGWTIWGAIYNDWLDAVAVTAGVFAVGVVVHVMLHWSWICGTVVTRLLHRKAGKDDGTQTLIGVAFLILLLHLFGAGLLAARVALHGPL